METIQENMVERYTTVFNELPLREKFKILRRHRRPRKGAFLTAGLSETLFQEIAQKGLSYDFLDEKIPKKILKNKKIFNNPKNVKTDFIMPTDQEMTKNIRSILKRPPKGVIGSRRALTFEKYDLYGVIRIGFQQEEKDKGQIFQDSLRRSKKPKS